MKNKGILWISLGILFFAFFSLWLRIPLASSSIWMSPDETANVVSAVNFSENFNFGYFSAIAEKFAWAHPRSFVYVPETNLVAPIGFLGMPFILAVVYKLFGLLGINFFAPFLALITLFPLWHIMPKTWSKPARVMALLIWMSTPTVILYVNRGNFPQLSQLCLMIWSWWLITGAYNLYPKENKTSSSRFLWFFGILKKISLPLAGMAAALALAVRPPEAIWIIPILLLAFLDYNAKQSKPELNNLDQKRRGQARLALLFMVPFVLVMLFFAKLGADTYGKWFVSGYQIRPVTQGSVQSNSESESPISASNQAMAAYSDSVSFLDTLPFSFHPRHIWWNFKNYYLWLLLPWTVMVLGAMAVIFKEKVWNSNNKFAILALAWTCFILIVFYGNGIYQDHVRVNEISLGNSFLRYTLPVSLAVALASGFIFGRLWRHWSLKLFAVCITVGLSSYGIWVANYAYDESLVYVERELAGYREVRAAAQKDFSKNGIVISDRSDKIFFPALNAISPMPDTEKIKVLLAGEYPIRFYLPSQDFKGLEKWEAQNIALRPVFTLGNQTLYDVFLLGE